MSILNRFARFSRQPEFRAHPVRALAKRAMWRLHWRILPNRPLTIRNWWKGLSLSLPNSGSGAHLYYRQFSSASAMRAAIEFLAPNATMLDVGAHVGEYTLVAGSCVKPNGTVHAFEPQPGLQQIIMHNVQANQLGNVKLYGCAVADHSNEISLVVDRRSMGGWISPVVNCGETIGCIQLDEFIQQQNISKVDLIKLDAAGNEIAVLRGARNLLLDDKPVIICKFYHSDVTRARFGYDSRETLATLQKLEYDTYLLDGSDWSTQFAIGPDDDIYSNFRGDFYCLHVLALPRNA